MALKVQAPRFFMLRIRRDGPLVAARLRWLDHAPQDPPDNKLDRGRLSVFPAADIAGAEVPPEEVTDRLHWPASHWKSAAPISGAEYRYQFDRIRWAERNRPSDPALQPRRAVDPAQLPLPDFTPENV